MNFAGYIDTHCHLAMHPLVEDVPGVIARARDCGLSRMLVVASDGKSSQGVLDLVERYGRDGLSAAVGIHPHDAKSCPGGLPSEIREFAGLPAVAAIGETGLDYYYDHSPREVQRALFREHIDLARDLGKPLVVHIRDAYDDALQILEEERASDCGGVIHCFSATVEYARKAMELGFYISFSGLVTFPNAGNLRKTAALLPEEVILCETDAPFLAPQPVRGKTNEPANVRFVYEEIARSRGVALDELVAVVERNATRLFGWGV
ncbi:MAG TPA: TatD family deoxyribonuclease [Synergistaceae bacterium]|nr:MAG: Hydrolase, TatD family [Synergistales bacterium 53_16]KUL03839.1 MAG: Hydrolase, TatD family [Synergistales bacterium 54_9]HAA47140.1 TatD family deoxyribonuclease [Synergistaceae bacterium]HAG23194.1 TatD family deoxyribonuclease [Synergistaceae bacterium]